MADLRYDFLDNNFTTYESVETPKVEEIELPLGNQKLSVDSFIGFSNDGIPIAKNTFSQQQPTMIMDKEEPINQPQLEEIESSKPQQVKGNSLENGKRVINALMSRLNLSKEQAAGIAGVMMSESGINPASYNKAEKSGKLKGSSANGAGYGAGMLQWSNNRKRAALRLIGKEGSNIEDLSLEDQIEMLARELEGPYKSTLAGIRSSKNASEAAATMYCHNVGGFSSSINPATKQEIEQMNKRYSKFARNIVNRGMSYAESLAKS